MDAYPATGFQIGAVLDAVDAGAACAQLAIDLRGAPVRAELLTTALTGRHRRHPALRTAVELTTAVPLLLVHPAGSLQLAEPDLSGSVPVAAEQALATWRTAPPPERRGCARLAVHRMPAGGASVTIDCDAPTLDPRAAARLARELLADYLSELEGHPTLPDSADAGRDAAAWRAEAEACAPDLDWQELAGRIVDPAGQRGTERRAQRSTGLVPPAHADALRRVAERLRVPLVDVLLAVHIRLLGLLTGQARVSTWVWWDQRAASGVDSDAVGEFRAGLPVAVDRDVASWSGLARRAHWARVEAGRMAWHGAVPPGRGSSFEYREQDPSRAGVADPRLGSLRVTYRDRSPAPFAVTVTDRGADGLAVEVLHREGDARSGLDALLRGLVGVAEDSDRDPRPSRGLLALPAPGGDAPPPGETVLELIRSQATVRPDAASIEDGDQVLTYRELWLRVTRVAEGLPDMVPAGGLVGVYLPRSADLVVGLLGILAAGRVPVPLDVDYPPARTAAALTDTSVALLVTRTELADRLAAGYAGPVQLLEPIGAGGPAGPPAAQPRPGGSAAAPAYILFTSGSTGRPKGVEVTQRAVANLAGWSGRALGLGPGDRVAQRTPVGFDAAMWEIFATLCCGATLVVVPTAADRDIAGFGALLRDRRLTVVQLVPSLLDAHVEAGSFADCPDLRLVLCGGEPLPSPLAQRFAQQATVSLINVYGPTECTVDASWWVAGADPVPSTPTVPIGRPVDGVRMYVLDELGEPVPAVVPGELYLGGVQLAQGYRGRPADTAERFLPDHLSGTPGARLYRTGDRVRWLGDRAVEFVGRLDRQVKVRGVRTEIGEVEAAFAGCPGVRRAVVSPEPDANGAFASAPRFRSGPGLGAHPPRPAGEPVHLVAYLVPDRPDSDPQLLAGVRAHLRTRLPDAMVPTEFHLLDELPLLPNGKLDRRRLPAQADRAAAGYRPPAGVARQLAELCARFLGVDEIGRDDSLAELGLDRLVAHRLAGWLRGPDRPGPPVAAVRAAVTVVELARVIHREGEEPQ